MNKVLLVIDMQNDFISGSLGTEEAKKIVSNVSEKIKQYKNEGGKIIFTRDTHQADYMKTQEGKMLPVEHCIEGTNGHEISKELDSTGCVIIDKPSFGSIEIAEYISEIVDESSEIEVCGLCTDICVVSNALIIKAMMPEIKISLDSSCCAGVTKESHEAALTTMKMCQICIS